MGMHNFMPDIFQTKVWQIEGIACLIGLTPTGANP
jgi:hypothetical protein